MKFKSALFLLIKLAAQLVPTILALIYLALKIDIFQIPDRINQIEFTAIFVAFLAAIVSVFLIGIADYFLQGRNKPAGSILFAGARIIGSEIGRFYFGDFGAAILRRKFSDDQAPTTNQDTGIRGIFITCILMLGALFSAIESEAFGYAPFLVLAFATIGAVGWQWRKLSRNNAETKQAAISRRYLPAFIFIIPAALLGAAAIYQAADFLVIPLFYSQAFLVYLIFAISLLLPISPAGIGLREVGIFLALKSFGVDGVDSFFLSLHLFTGWLALALCGIVFTGIVVGVRELIGPGKDNQSE